MKYIFLVHLFILPFFSSFAQKTAVINPGRYDFGGITTAQKKILFKNNNIYVVRRNAEVYRYNGAKWDYLRCTNNMKILDFEIANDGSLWLGGELGLYKTDTTFFNNSKDVFPVEINGKRIFDSAYIIKQMKDGVWVFSNKGLTVYNGNDTHYVNINSSIVSEMLEDRNGHVFMASNKGLLVLKNNLLTTFDSTNSILPGGLIKNLHLTNTGEVWFNVENNERDQPVFFWKSNLIYPLTTKNCKKIPTVIANITSDNQGGIYFLQQKTNGDMLYQFNQSNNKVNYIINYFNTFKSHFHSIKGVYSHNGNFVFLADSIRFLPSNFVQKQFEDSLERYERLIERLDANNLSTIFLTGADFGWDLNRNLSHFPKTNCKTNFWAGSIWLSDSVNGEVHTAAQTYRQQGYDFYPGPINKIDGIAVAHPFKERIENEYSKPARVKKSDIDLFRQNFINGGNQPIPSSILKWPAHGDTTLGQLYQLAPFIDVNNDGHYDPSKGDYPDIKGDMAIFWVFNDAYLHTETGGKPFNFQFNAMAYSYACSDIVNGSSDEALNNSLFITYKIINRGNQHFNNIKLGLWLGVSIGNFKDDYVSCNPRVGYGYGYNGDAFDEYGYGNKPSTIAVVPIGSDSSQSYLDGFISYNNDYSLTGNPTRSEHYYYYLNNRFKDYTHLSYGGTGYEPNSTNLTKHMFPGKHDKLNRPFWSPAIANIPMGNKSMVLTIPSFSLPVDADTTVTFALVSSIPNDSASTDDKISFDVKKVKGWYAANNFPSCGKLIASINEPSSRNKHKIIVYPNPARESIHIRFEPTTHDNLRIYNLEGKVVLEKTAVLNNTPVDISVLPAGFYIIELKTDTHTHYHKMIKE
ncbi:MAG: T9SS C-terminal target domain-containing protein [Bacteroidetes bacterium]|nr:MAG: T9SS C-terminal target domain-containing protein [Bacteroidota bacterium]